MNILRPFLICLFLLLPGVIDAQQDYLVVTPSGNQQLQLHIAPSVVLGGGINAEMAREMGNILNFDMTLAGFSVASPPVAETTGIRPGEFNFSPWRAAGADLLVKMGDQITGDSVSFECRLFDVARERELTAKRYSGKRQDLRKIVHTFSDDILQAVTGERGPFTGKIVFVSKSTGNKEICLMDYDGYNVLRLTKNGSINLNPEFSPSGREIIFTSYKKRNPDLYRRELYTGAEARISASSGINITAAYAPDGNRIALAKSKDGHSQIYLISKEGKDLARLTHTNAIDVSPAWSPDGARIAFVSDRLGSPQVFVMNADGSGAHRLTTSGSYNVSPRWSPKGDKILYCRQEGGFQIYSINPDGTGDARLTAEGNNEHPRWSPDGRFITFSSKRGGAESIYIMRSDGTGQTRVSRGKAEESHPSWSPRS